MAFLYELAILGSPTDQQVRELERLIRETVAAFGFQVGDQVALRVNPQVFAPDQATGAAAVFFGGKDAPQVGLESLLRSGVPVLPVVSHTGKVQEEIPTLLRPLNCLPYDLGGDQRVATALLECAGLLPRQRRVFVSYRRDEAREAALQLFDEFSGRMFDVYLDTHGTPPAEHFQPVLWHRLCDSDVLVMLDTAGYFESRWTSAEFGRALAKGISVLRIGWPGKTASPRTETANHEELLTREIDATTGRLSEEAIARICLKLEFLRSRSHAVRGLNLMSSIRDAVERIGGTIAGVGIGRTVYARLADDRTVMIYPTLGVPTSASLHEAEKNGSGCSVGVVYDPVGLHPDWQAHLDWLGDHIRVARWVKSTELAWRLADWET